MSTSDHADGVRNRLLRLGAAVAVGAGMLTATGCGQDSGCEHTALELVPATFTGLDDPLTLRATLTSDGAPLADFRLIFSAVVTGPKDLVGKSGQALSRLAYVMTDTNGVATYTTSSGIGEQLLPMQTPIGYDVSLITANPINGKYYCDTRESANFVSG